MMSKFISKMRCLIKNLLLWISAMQFADTDASFQVFKVLATSHWSSHIFSHNINDCMFCDQIYTFPIHPYPSVPPLILFPLYASWPINFLFFWGKEILAFFYPMMNLGLLLLIQPSTDVRDVMNFWSKTYIWKFYII